MKRKREYLVLLIALVLVVGLWAVPASAGKYGAKTSISTDRKTCEVTGTLTWRMESIDTAKVGVWETDPSYELVGDWVYATSLTSRGQISVKVVGVPGRTYQAVGHVQGSPGGVADSRQITLTCG